MKYLSIILLFITFITASIVSANPKHSIVTIKARLIYYDEFYQAKVVRYARARVFGIIEGMNTQLKQIYIDSDGYINEQVDIGPAQTIYLVFYTADDHTVTVMSNVDNSSSVYSTISPARNPVSGIVDFGPLIVDADAPARKAWYIYSQIADRAWNYFAMPPISVNFNSNDLKVQWFANSDEGAYYNRTKKAIYLLGVNAWEPDMILHEFGHYVQQKTYVTPPPVATDCQGWEFPGPQAVCAMDEGWPTFLQGAIQNHRRYQGVPRPGGERKTRDLEFPKASGQNVPGAFAAFLWDIYDPKNETCDTIQNGINGNNMNGLWKIYSQNQPTTDTGFVNAWLNSANGFITEVTVLAKHHKLISDPSPCKNKYVFIPVINTPNNNGD